MSGASLWWLSRWPQGCSRQWFCGRRTRALTFHEYVRLGPEGSASVIIALTLRNQGSMPMETFSFHSGLIPGVRCLDGAGREVPVKFEPKQDRYELVATLREPVLPGDPLSLKLLWEAPGAASGDGDAREYALDWQWGSRLTAYRYAISLPAGAELLSADPRPDLRPTTAEGSQVIRFEAVRAANERFRCAVKYRLP